ncbi:MAG: alpha/beta fold hydrolase, partial [Gammaproteobacteria bacterium]|nr:alpha/beta fold hydrolase [Gammaproteobacteria bacterium]
MNAATHPTHRFIEANGMRLCVEERGRPEGEPMLLVMGLAAQMTLWPEALLRHWVEAGYRVIRFDNRDIGLSSEIPARLQGSGVEAMLRFRLGLPVPAPYTLHDMADDALALMDALGLERVHL